MAAIRDAVTRAGHRDENQAVIDSDRAQIPPDIVKKPDAEGVAIFFFDLIDTAELNSSTEFRIGIVESSLLARFDLSLEVKGQLVIDLAIHLGSMEG